ncbi:MAG: 50S ribosomal protein L17 [Thermodesulfobacteriota bacterium]
MRHNRDEKRFDRTSSHLKAMMSNMTNDLLAEGRIKTTTPKAKLLRRYAEKMITLGKNGSVAARRRAMAFMRSKTTVTRLFVDIAPRFKDRNGGYTRILKIGHRPGDNAPMALIELVEETVTPVEAKPKPKKKTPAKKAAAKKPADKKPAAKKAAPKKAAAEKAPKKEAAAKKPAAKKAPAKKKEPAAKTKKEE